MIPQFYYIKVGFEGVKIIYNMFSPCDKTNAPHESTDEQTKKNWNRGTALKQFVEKQLSS